MVGISLPSSGATGTSPFVATNVEFTPAGFTGRITDDWTSVPYCTTDFAPYNNTTTDHLVTIHNPATGVGDICRYMGVVDGARWRVPTAAEWIELYGSDQQNGGQAVKLGNGWIAGNYYPISGVAMGPNQNSVAIAGNVDDARVINANPYVDGAVFLPSSGQREETVGATYWIGDSGYYWSSTASDAGNGYNIKFNSSNVGPQDLWHRPFARSIRCIRE